MQYRLSQTEKNILRRASEENAVIRGCPGGYMVDIPIGGKYAVVMVRFRISTMQSLIKKGLINHRILTNAGREAAKTGLYTPLTAPATDTGEK